MRAWKIRGIVLVVVVLAAPSLLARESGPTEWPLERIITNLEARLREAPDDAEAHYNLGRAHAFAFALERSSFLVFGNGYVRNLEDQPKVTECALERDARKPAVLLGHLADGVSHLRRACELESTDASVIMRRHLTLAWLLETGAHLADRVDTVTLLRVDRTPLSTDAQTGLQVLIEDLGSIDASVASTAQRILSSPTSLERALPLLSSQTSSPNARRQKAVAALLERYWIEQAIGGYWHTLELAFAQDIGTHLGPRNDEELRHMVSYEALEGYCRLVRARGVQSPEEERRLTEAAERRKQLEDLPRSSWITPIILTLDGCKTLDDLVASSQPVLFDLDGNGVEELWPWLAPGTGWLVWDPEQRGEITSGRQLFGSASAWLFFEDGYRVLDALDDNRDGRLTGAELVGIAVWFDRDSDGICGRGEVSTVEELGIIALSTQATERVGRSPANLCGLELADGRVLPTYDWVLAPMSE